MKEEEIISRTRGAIRTIRGQHVIIDADLAALFEVATKRINEQAKRNPNKFPEDFRFQLTVEEFNDLKSQNETSSWGGTRKLPYAYTEHGVLQVANVTSSSVADAISVFVIRAFIEMRSIMGIQRNIAARKAAVKTIASTTKLSKFMQEIGPRLAQAMEQVMDTVIDAKKGTTIAEEVQDIISESIDHLKSRLKKAGLENEEIAARITKLLAEAARERAEARKVNAETEQLEFFVMTRKLKLVLEAQTLLFQGEVVEEKQLQSFIQLLNRYAKE